jgi:putative FmdB family regulatory protein
LPIYEYECEECGERFEELVASSDAPPPACPNCGTNRARRLISPISPPGRQPRGAAVRSDESRRREGIAAHKERLARDIAERPKRAKEAKEK